MPVLHFDKNELGNLEYSLQREMLSTNRAGGYMSTTMVCCNTRKYHGLMVCPISEQEENNYVLLSSLDETILQNKQLFNLAIHRYPGVYEPRGNKYITDFLYTPTPTLIYRVGRAVLKKELLWIHDQTQLLIRYTLLESHDQTTLRLRPFLAFRNRHTVGKANSVADGRSFPIPGGVKSRLYEGFPYLHMQTNCQEADFVTAPEWYLNFEYAEELRRGYPGHEDLLTTGYFELSLAPAQSVIFSGSTQEIDPQTLAQTFEQELSRRSNKVDFISCLEHSARQFIIRQGEKSEVVAGYPWFGRWGRDTFIALPGITLTQDNIEACRGVINTMTREMQDGLFPNMGSAYNSVDSPLWFFWTLQALEKHLGAQEVWLCYGRHMVEILNAYRQGIGEGIRVDDNMLVWASNPHLAMTWMDAVVDGRPVTGRDGYQVEINALWYNAVCYTLELARKHDSHDFVAQWEMIPPLIKSSFEDFFWDRESCSLADYVDQNGQNLDIRPNQIIACSLPYTMLTEQQQLGVIGIVRRHLLTPRGLRTLSPRHPHYHGHCQGDQPTRDRAYHQGTVWPWLLEHYVAANFRVSQESFRAEAVAIMEEFSDEISTYGLASIAEIFDGDPPHTPRGAISQAWSVAAILRIGEMIQKY